MKKLVLVVAMFMFVCGSSFFAMAQDHSVASLTPGLEMVNDTVITDTTKTDSPAVPDTTATPVQTVE